MPDNSTDALGSQTAVAADEAAPARRIDGVEDGTDAGRPDESERRSRRGRRVRRTDWRLGGHTTAAWRERLLAIALISLGIGVLGGAAISEFVQAPWAAQAANALLWIGMGAPAVWALARSRPIGLLRFRPQDLVFGLGLGILLRLAQGWLEVALGGSAAFPSYPTIGGALSDGWLFDEVVAPVAIAPLVEEFFFRAVVLVAVYTITRRALGKLAAGAAAVLASSGLFLLVHSITGALALDQVLSLALVAIVCSLLVLLTGRIWPAVLAHAVYNGSYVALALVGTLWGS